MVPLLKELIGYDVGVLPAFVFFIKVLDLLVDLFSEATWGAVRIPWLFMAKKR